MSYQVRSFCTIKCDQPGCDRHLSDEWDYGEIGWYPSMGHADEAAQDNGWQVKGDGIHAKHYCPDHIHATCHRCGRTETNDIDTLNSEKWWNAGWDNTMCPGCVRRSE